MECVSIGNDLDVDRARADHRHDAGDLVDDRRDEGLAAEAGIDRHQQHEVEQAVMAGLGIAFISGHTIEQELQLQRLVILDVEGMPIRRQWFAVSRLKRSQSPAMRAFQDFLTLHCPAYLPVTPKTYPMTAFPATTALGGTASG
jgi:DNA-binding transcriptional LysR family regulator